MKKLLALLLALSMLFALCACGGSESARFTPGTVNGSRYESSFLGLACELDDSWLIKSDEELAEMMGRGVEHFNDPEEYRKMLENASVIQDFTASHSSGASINIVFQKLSGVTRLLGAEQWRDTGVPALEKTFGDISDLTDMTVEKNSLDLAGATHPGTIVRGRMFGGDFCSQQIYIKAGGYIAIITFTSLHEEDIDVMAGFFSALS